MYLTLFNIIAPVLFCAGLGYGWQRCGRPFDKRMVTDIAVNIATPCLLLSSLAKIRIAPDIFVDMALAAALAILTFVILAAIVLHLFRLPWHTYLPAMMLPNTGNMGLPLCLFAFGDEGLALALAVFAVNAACQFTIGHLISAGTFSMTRFLKTPIIYAVALALFLMAYEIPLPLVVQNITSLLGGLAIPLMLMALGVSLAGLKMRDARRSLLLGGFRITMGLAVGLGLSALLELEGAARGVLIITSTMPTAVFNYLFAEHNGRDSAAVAGIVVASTLMGFLILPIVLMIALNPSFLW